MRQFVLDDSHYGCPSGARLRTTLDGQFFTLAYMSTEAALAHQGVAMGRMSLVADWLEAGRLVAPFKQRIKSPTRYCPLYPKELAQQPGMRAVMQWLQEQAKATQAS